jgi:nitrite reductase (NADH) small subunit
MTVNTATGWIEVCGVTDIPVRGSRIVRSAQGDIALFRTVDDEVFALFDKCPHKGGPLSQGIVHGRSVTCPLHNWVIGLEDGKAQGADSGCTPKVPVRITDQRVMLMLAAARSEAA